MLNNSYVTEKKVAVQRKPSGDIELIEGGEGIAIS